LRYAKIVLEIVELFNESMNCKTSTAKCISENAIHGPRSMTEISRFRTLQEELMLFLIVIGTDDKAELINLQLMNKLTALDDFLGKTIRIP
jgi:hypothetical protein